MTQGQFFDVASAEGLQVALTEFLATATGQTSFSSNDPARLYRVAENQLKIKNYTGARPLLEKVVTLSPNYLRSRRLLIWTYYELFELDRLIQLCRQFILDDPSNRAFYEAFIEKAEAQRVYKIIFDEAYKLAKQGDFSAAIENMGQISLECTCSALAQSKIKEWTAIVRQRSHKALYDEALELVGEEKFAEAIKNCWLIPKDSIYYAKAQVKIKEWTYIQQKYKNNLGMEFVKIKPGTFMMGSPESETGRDNDEGQHEVTLTKGFLMQTTEVTQAQWQAVMGTSVAQQRDEEPGSGLFVGDNPSRGLVGIGDNYPMYWVSWYEAEAFITRLNQRGEGVYRLPTEAEWEYAARAGSSTKYSFGNDAEQLHQYGNYAEHNDGHKEVAPVGSYKPNLWGLYDMHGNVQEWVKDAYNMFYCPNNESCTLIDPVYIEFRGWNVFRGGSWYNTAQGCRSAARHNLTSTGGNRRETIGFRVVKEAAIDWKQTQPLVHPSNENTEVIRYINATDVNMRKLPSTHADVITLLDINTQVTIIGEKIQADGYTWVHVKLSDGRTGWVVTKYLRI